MIQNRPPENLEAVMTLHEVADVLGVTAGRVRQIERRALLKLRILLRNRGISVGDLVVDRGAVSHPLARNCM